MDQRDRSPRELATAEPIICGAKQLHNPLPMAYAAAARFANNRVLAVFANLKRPHAFQIDDGNNKSNCLRNGRHSNRGIRTRIVPLILQQALFFN